MFPTVDPAVSGPTYSQSAAGATLDTTQVNANRLGIASRDFNPDGTTGTLADRVRVNPNKFYKIRYHVT